MDLNHSFTVPVGVAEAWEAFVDIASVAECFPGAAVTSVEGDEFQGTVKVKLGPIALQYAGSGTFVERDEASRRLVLEAKGRDKRGNGTAGATVTATFAEEGDASTRIDVLTDLQITGKPAQFGRGVMQDVSDKLLLEFVTCLEARVAGPAPAPAAPAAPSVEPEVPTTPVASPAATAEVPAAAVEEPLGAAGTPVASPAVTASGRGPAEPVRSPQTEAIDLGATVLPILFKSYWKQFAGGVVVLLVIRWLWRRRG